MGLREVADPGEERIVVDVTRDAVLVLCPDVRQTVVVDVRDADLVAVVDVERVHLAAFRHTERRVAQAVDRHVHRTAVRLDDLAEEHFIAEGHGLAVVAHNFDDVLGEVIVVVAVQLADLVARGGVDVAVDADREARQDDGGGVRVLDDEAEVDLGPAAGGRIVDFAPGRSVGYGDVEHRRSAGVTRVGHAVRRAVRGRVLAGVARVACGVDDLLGVDVVDDRAVVGAAGVDFVTAGDGESEEREEGK